ncbi:restriction endonuclease [Patescibacteria group bacterium]|nr:restriction endonuclease [Patescibacteria group bacterium]
MPNNSKNDFFVVKANGQKEKLDFSKIINSLKRAGATNEQVKETLRIIYPQLRNNLKTNYIYKLVFDALRKTGGGAAPLSTRYSLKNAIFELGPSGFPFEQFVSGVFSNLGYKCVTNVFLKGKCVEHEIDVLMEKDNEKFTVEAKFHSKPGYKTDLKIALYVFARYLDIVDTNGKITPYLITNTKITSEVIAYAACTGLKVISWEYPAGGSLRELIDKSKLHPITCLTSIDKFTKNILIANNIVFSKDLEKHRELFSKEEDYNRAVEEAKSL